MAKLKAELAALNPFKTDVDRAAAEIAKLEGLRDKLVAVRAQAETEITNCKRELPAAELTAELAESEPEGAAAAILENIRTAEATIARADRMLQPLQGRLRDAHANLREAQAAEIDKRADKLEKELGEHVAAVQAAMEALSSLEGGATYVSSFSHQRQILELVQATGGKDRTPPPDMIASPMPKSMRLAQEVGHLRDLAVQIRGRQVRSAGRVSGYSLEELLTETRKPGLIACSFRS